MKIYWKLVYILIFVSSFLACNENDSIRNIEVFTGEVEEVENSMQIQGYYQDVLIELDYNGNVNSTSLGIAEHGHCWSLDSLPTVVDECTRLGSLSLQDTFYSTINGIIEGETYFSRAYVIADNKIYYGNIIEFTSNVEVIEPGPEPEPEPEPQPEPEPEPVSWWEEKKFFPGETNSSYGGFVISNYYYAGFSSRDDSDENLKFWKINIDNNKWEEIEEFEGDPVINAVTLSLNNRAYVIGGTRLYYRSFASDQFYVYNPDEDEWDDLDDFKGRARKNAMGFTLNNKIYYGLGENRSDIYEYDVNKEKWKELKTDLPKDLRKRENAITFTSSGEAYIGFGTEKEFKNDLWKYNPEEDSWVQLSSFPGSGRVVSCLFKLENKAYFVGGNNGNGIAEHWIYYLNEDRWQKLEDNFEYLSEVAFGLALNGKGYALLSSDQSFWQFTPPTE